MPVAGTEIGNGLQMDEQESSLDDLAASLRSLSAVNLTTTPPNASLTDNVEFPNDTKLSVSKWVHSGEGGQVPASEEAESVAGEGRGVRGCVGAMRLRVGWPSSGASSRGRLK